MKQTEYRLSELGIRPTAIRLLVLKEITGYNRAFTLADMEQRLATLDRSTLFRTLTLFVKHKLLHETDNGNGSKLYCPCEYKHEHRHAPHLHFICSICHKTYCIKDIDLSTLPKPEGYEVEEVNLIMRGLCPKCKRSKA